jgi:PKD repeat protein
MKMNKKLFKFLFLSMITILLAHSSCQEDEPEPEVPVASFTYEGEELKVTFTNTSTNATAYSWDFGDSNTSTDKDPVHTYASRGTYDVKLTVVNGALADEQSMTIEVTEPEIRALIVNEGNFGAGNGSISYYYEESQRIANDTVKLANNDSEIGSTIQSVLLYDTVGYIVCNTSDKVEFIHNKTFNYLANPITNISQPRYMTASGDKGYLTCWGPWAADWTLPDSYVAVIDLNSREVIDSLVSGSGPEGILVVDDKLFVANSYEDSITVVDLNNEATSKIATASAPKHFALDATGLLWASTSNGLQSFNAETLEPVDTIDIANMSGKMAIDGVGKNIYYLTSEPWPGTNTTVFVFDTETKSSSASALITGENFYGIGYNPVSDLIYVGDSKAFAGPGQINIHDTNGTLVDSQISGVGPNGFIFN